MNKHEESRLESCDDIIELLTEYDSSLAAIPVLRLRREDLVNIVAGIRSNEELLDNSTTGKTESKHVSLDELIHDTLVISAGIYSYAYSQNLTELMALSDISDRDLRRLRLTEIPITSKAILTKADELGDLLIQDGILVADRDELRNDLAVYTVKDSDQGKGTLDRSSARNTITELFVKMNNILELIDKQMVRFAKKNAEFYGKYTIARQVKDKAVRHKLQDNTEPAQNPSV